jgi:hypothetical protein
MCKILDFAGSFRRDHVHICARVQQTLQLLTRDVSRTHQHASAAFKLQEEWE